MYINNIKTKSINTFDFFHDFFILILVLDPKKIQRVVVTVVILPSHSCVIADLQGTGIFNKQIHVY